MPFFIISKSQEYLIVARTETINGSKGVIIISYGERYGKISTALYNFMN